MTSLRDLTFALHEYDFAQRAQSHGARSSIEVLLHAIRNLPAAEMEELRGNVERLIEKSVTRTEVALQNLGIDLDMKFPPNARSAYQTPLSRAEADKAP